MEAMMKSFLKNMSQEDKKKMMEEFMNSMTDEEKSEMIQQMMPLMMEHMNPGMMMSYMSENFSEDHCKNMIEEMPSEIREKCMNMMTTCLRTLQQEKTIKK